MDFSKLIDVKSVFSGLIVLTIATIIGFFSKKPNFLRSKFKSVSSFLHLPVVKEHFGDIYKRIFQNHKVNETQQSLPDYIRSFGSWKSKSGDGITLSITVDSESRIYNDVTSVRAYQIDPLSQFYGLDMECKKPGYVLYGKSILGIRPTEIVKIAKKCYFQELKEGQNNETSSNN